MGRAGESAEGWKTRAGLTGSRGLQRGEGALRGRRDLRLAGRLRAGPPGGQSRARQVGSGLGAEGAGGAGTAVGEE